MAPPPRLTLISPLRVWLAFNALFVVLVASSWYSSYRLAAADNQRLVASQARTLVKSRFDDLRARRFRDFVEGIGQEFGDHYVRVSVGGDAFQFGTPPQQGHCSESSHPLPGAADGVRVTVCRPFHFSTRPVFGVLAVYLVIAGLSLALVRRLERRTTTTLVEFLRDSGVELDPGRDLVGLLADMRDIRARLDQAKDQERQLRDARVRAEVAEQVAHDIRSPLSALDAAAAATASLPEWERSLIRDAVAQARAIADDLLQRYRAAGRGAAEPATVQPLAALVEAAVAGKRLELRSRPGVELAASIEPTAHQLHARVQAVEFQRVLSNLLNNAVEAMDDRPGRVLVQLAGSREWVAVAVCDDGKGIAPDAMPGLGARGASHGKAGGSGLGLHHARSCAESWGGRLELASTPGKGTTVTLLLPRATMPAWDAVLIDNNPLVRRAWELSAANARRKARTYASVDEFIAACDDIDRKVPIYVDSRLGDGIRGEDESKKITELGFVEVYLATGDESAASKKPAHVRQVVGKDPPWDDVS